ncbi:Spermatogenesis-associated protein 5 [Anabarilius grahami]|uniref:Spermatogenesis-associated protein 5 n=1 Tax=Anabarilius grahami TaxID=495550 RepID=A0A3N0Y4P9_ANAGA|nr:Spermatogenesis-associated protein 5 [Anabarilius grahami]
MVTAALSLSSGTCSDVERSVILPPPLWFLPQDALMRPGRLDRVIFVPLPDTDTRREIFTLQFRNMPVHPSVHLEDLVTRTERYSGAEITAVCREAALQALQENIAADHVTAGHFHAALDAVRPRIPQSLLQSYVNYQREHGGSRV